MLEVLYEEMKQRLAYLELESYNYENEIRAAELTLVMVRVQQMMLEELEKKNDGDNKSGS